MKRQFPALRGLAIVLVVVNHTIMMGISVPSDFGYPPVSEWLRVVLMVISQFGWLAVPAFLLISGGFFAYAAQGNPPHLSYKVVWANLKHILWPYVIWSVIFYIYIFIINDQRFTIWGYIKNIIVGYPFHFIPLMIFYYLVSPLLIRLSNRFGWIPILIVIAAYQVFLVLVLDAEMLGLNFPAWLSGLTPPVLARTMADWGIYFPLGLYFSLKTDDITPIINKFVWLFTAITIMFLLIVGMHTAGLINVIWSRHIYPFSFVILIPIIRRDWIPAVKRFENIGRKAYGLYLTHLIVVSATLLLIQNFVPWLLGYQLALQVVLLAIALSVPLLLMEGISRAPKQKIYRYLFG